MLKESCLQAATCALFGLLQGGTTDGRKLEGLLGVIDAAVPEETQGTWLGVRYH